MRSLIKTVEPETDFKIRVCFNNGVKKEYDIKPLFKEIKAFRALLKHPPLFNNVEVCFGGYGIRWNDKIDLAFEEIWDNGITL